MKTATSWTRQESARLHCPKRFYFRYMAEDPTGQLKAYSRLRSVRELGGHVVHEALAKIITNVAKGSRISDERSIINTASRKFEEIVQRSLRTAKGLFLECDQLAETFNGIDPHDDIRHWKDLIPVAIENGLRVMIHFNVRTNSTDYSVEAEKICEFSRKGKKHRFVIDTLISENKNHTVIDWKCHSIENKDLYQVELYQHYLNQSAGIPITRIYGFAVDLLREEIMECHYRPFDHLIKPRKQVADTPDVVRDSYPAKPSLSACGICPFASLCPHSVIPFLR